MNESEKVAAIERLLLVRGLAAAKAAVARDGAGKVVRLPAASLRARIRESPAGSPSPRSSVSPLESAPQEPLVGVRGVPELHPSGLKCQLRSRRPSVCSDVGGAPTRASMLRR